MNEIERLAELSEALEPFSKYGEVAERLGTCDCVCSIRQRLGDGPEETLAEISKADCVKAHEVFSSSDSPQVIHWADVAVGVLIGQMFLAILLQIFK